MNQINAIFLKDARRFWPEIAINLLLLAAFVVVYPVNWQHDSSTAYAFGLSFAMGEGGKGFLASTLVVLIPISWLILIARVIHCERLVGDTQFWLTRPYEWPKLIAAKALFLGAFLYLPLLIAQCVLLSEAGFRPTAHIGGLLFNLLLVTVILVLPTVALSSLTAGMARFLLILLGFIIIVVVMMTVSAYFPRIGASGTPDLISGDIAFSLLLIGSAACIATMYARRLIKLGWIVFAGTLLLLWILSIVDPDRMFMARFFPTVNATTSPVRISYAAEGLRQPVARETQDKDQLQIGVPISAYFLRTDYAVVPRSIRVSMVGPGATRWQSEWQHDNAAYLLAGTSESSVDFFIPRRIYDQWKGTSLNLNLEFAVAIAREVRQSTIKLPNEEFSVDGFGVCTPWSWYPNKREYTAITCRSALRQPELTYVTVPWAVETCSTTQNLEDPGMLATAWAGNLSTAPADFGITSVWSIPINLSNPWILRPSAQARPRLLCPGAPITFRQFQEADRMTLRTTIENFRMPEIMSAGQMRVVVNESTVK